MHFLVEFIILQVVKWIAEHPDAAFSRHMTAQRGPRTDVANLTRLQRLKSGLSYLGWAVVSFIVLSGAAYLVFGRGLLAPDNVVFMAALFGLTIWTMICIGAAICLLVRVLF